MINLIKEILDRDVVLEFSLKHNALCIAVLITVNGKRYAKNFFVTNGDLKSVLEIIKDTKDAIYIEVS